VAVTCTVAATVACGTAEAPDGAAAPDAPEVVVDGLDGPTQFVALADGSYLVAQLAGDEDDGTGQVVLVGSDGGRQVLLDGLDVPTGVAVAGGAVWVAQASSLVRAEWAGPGGPVGPVQVVQGDLPNNGRSQGSLEPTPDGRMLFATTGSTSGGSAVPRSGTLWSVPVGDPGADPTPLAVGAKNAYATAVLADGEVAVTEIGDAREPPPDLLVRFPLPPPGVPAGPVDLGWPGCRPVGPCAGVVDPIATFAPGATPTGLVADGADLLVALFTEGRVVRVPGDGGVQRTVLDGLEGPHSLVRAPDGRVLVSEHLADRIVVLPLGSTPDVDGQGSGQ